MLEYNLLFHIIMIVILFFSTFMESIFQIILSAIILYLSQILILMKIYHLPIGIIQICFTGIFIIMKILQLNKYK
jgi:hypothetical protein